jgi:hypothetical protein
MLFASTVAFGIALLTTGLVGGGEPHESLRGRGIFSGEANGSALYLFAEVHRCGPEQVLPVAQILVSTDGGTTWQKRGPALEGSELQFVQNTRDGLLVAGLHTAEGPGIDPFLLVPGSKRFEWEVHGIFEGPSELVGVAQTSATDLLAWIRPVDAAGEGPRRAIVMYRSTDGGRLWSRAGSSAEGARGPFKKFGRLTARSGAWRIVDRRDGGFDVRHHESAGWRTVKAFPWSTCEAPVASPPER